MKSQTRRDVIAGRIALGVVMIVLSGHAIAASAEAGTSAAPAKVLILAGGSGHDWRTTSAVLRQILEDSGRFDVRICESPAGLTARTLADFDVLVDDRSGGSLESETEDAIARWVEPGKGLVLPHAAPAAPRYGPADGSRREESRVEFL